jgi:ATP-dependent Clp protease ATP-binding subunit ClpB
MYAQIPAETAKLNAKPVAAPEGADPDDGDGAPLLSEVVSADDIAACVSRWTGIPVTRLGSSERERLLSLGARIKESVVGQDEAVRAIADAVVRSRSGLGRPGHPTGSFLLVGPTGVGKTQLAKSLAKELFLDERALIRLDMSEFMEQHSVAKLSGTVKKKRQTCFF